MLLSLHVKNLALIGEEEIEFEKGLNILSGETGAGKSIILGALQLALGAKVPKDFLRDPETEALVEAIFRVSSVEERLLQSIGIDIYDGEIILTRKISSQRSSAKINGESVTSLKMKEVGEILIDIYGQHDHQSLLKKSAHIKLLDSYSGEELQEVTHKISALYREVVNLKKEFEASDLDEDTRRREVDLLEHEISEIENANLVLGEDEALEEEHKRLSSSQKIAEAVSFALQATDADATDGIGRAIRELRDIGGIDGEIDSIASTLSDAEDILSDIHHRLLDYERGSEYNEEKLYDISKRLDEINRLKEKYARDTDRLEDVFLALEVRQSKLQKLNEHDKYIEELKDKIDRSQKALAEECDKATAIRKKYAFKLTGEIRNALLDLNFNGVEFEIKIEKTDECTPNGQDDVVFMISTNPGEALKPLQDVASGGELSRIMLAIKTVFAFEDGIDTLIFDEIDAGISGRTAVAVSKKLRNVAMEHQVICITHLPQIAAMANRHFLIEKSVSDDRTVSKISPLDYEGSVKELARMLGGETITEATLVNARELKESAGL